MILERDGLVQHPTLVYIRPLHLIYSEPVIKALGVDADAR